MKWLKTLVATQARKGSRMALFGVTQFARGVRHGSTPAAAAGAALLGLGLMRKLGVKGPEKVYSRRLKPGQEIRIRVVGDDDRGP